MALDKATFKTSIETACNALWSESHFTTLKTELLAAFDTAFAVTDPAQAQAARTACADAIGAAVKKYVHGADGTKVSTFAQALADAGDTFVKGATITINPAHVGLQTTTGLGAPTGGPAAPVPVNGAVS